MENRGQKRSEEVEELPMDKRACNPVDRRDGSGSTTTSSSQTVVNPVNSDHTEGEHENDSEDEHENDSGYGSCDSEGSGGEGGTTARNDLANYQRSKSSDQQTKLSQVTLNLREHDTDDSALAALTSLCEQLTYFNGYSLNSVMVDSLSPILVKLAKHETNPNIMLLAIRAITYTCDVYPRAVRFFVRHDVVPVLCQRLLAIEYLDVAEQCLQALGKISRDQPLACLQSGAVMAALTYIDFFSTSIQRVALSVVVNTCKKLPSELPSPLMEAVPILCNLLQYEDQQVVETVATCLMTITSRVSHSSEMINKICKDGLVNLVVQRIDMNSRTMRSALSHTVYTGLIGLLSKLAGGSFAAFKTLFELDISTRLKEILCSCYISSGLPSPNATGGHYNQMQEVLKLLNELLPSLDEGQSDKMASEKESYVLDRSDILRKFGFDILPPLIQVVNLGADMHICYGCLSVISKLVYFSQPEVLLDLLTNLNISSFLAGVFTRKDPHVLILALKISESILHKQSDHVMPAFIKDGVFYAIEALPKMEMASQFTYPMIDGTNLSNELSQKTVRVEVGRCLCYALHACQSLENSPCKLSQDSVYSLAKQIKLKFLPREFSDSHGGLTNIYKELRTLAGMLTELVTTVKPCDGHHTEMEGKFRNVLSLILEKLNGIEPVSSFEFIESGIVKALLTFLSHGTHLEQEPNNDTVNRLYEMDRRFQIFAMLSLSFLKPGDLPMLTLVRKLQNALSTLENFPVILSHPFKLRSSVAMIPERRTTTYPTFKVHFIKGEGEQSLSEYSTDCVTVDPFTSLKSIEEHLWSEVSITKECNASPSQAEVEMENMQSGEVNVERNNEDHMETDCMDTTLPSMQDGFAHLGDKVSEESVSQPVCMQSQCLRSCSKHEVLPNLSLYLGDQKLDLHHTLYQAVIKQQLKSGHDSGSISKFWTHVYNVTYRSAVNHGGSYLKQCCQRAGHVCSQNCEASWQCRPIASKVFDSGIACDLDQISPARDVLYLIRSLDCMNRNVMHLLSQERVYAFAHRKKDDLNSLAVKGTSVPQKEFVSCRLTEKIEQQMQDPAAVSVGGLPSWWNQLMASCPFLFAFDARRKYFRLSVVGLPAHVNSHNNSGSSGERRLSSSSLSRQKFLAVRDQILDSASKMMEHYACRKAVLEVEFGNEVGTGLGPTLEFYTLVSHEFQRCGMGMWREDSSGKKNAEDEGAGFLVSRFGLFPRPWPSVQNGTDGTILAEILRKFRLLGKIVAKALHDGRVLDLHLSRAFYKIILGQNLDLYDIQSFDPELGRALLKFKALSQRKLLSSKLSIDSSTSEMDTGSNMEDLSLDFTLPGYPDYVLRHGQNYEMVTIDNLEEYVSLVADATLKSGIYEQVEAFKDGFNQVFPIEHAYIFNEEELERLLCGEQNLLARPEELLDHVKFDHGYTVSSPPVINFLELLQDFTHDQQRAFVQFVTGTPRLPPGGLASLNPRLTIVRKHSDNFVDADLPSVMTCANYLKLPPYSSKEIMKEKLLYAISEGQGSFHLS